MKRIVFSVLFVFGIILITGCSIFPFNQKYEIKYEKPAKGNCNIFKCIQKIELDDDLEKINKVMGFEGELVRGSKYYSVYKWVINKEKNEVVQVSFHTRSSSISITFSNEDIKNPQVNFSKYEKLRKAINNKEKLKYEDIKKSFNADGVLIEKTSYNTKYRWVNSNGGYVNATFNNNTGDCTLLFGLIK